MIVPFVIRQLSTGAVDRAASERKVGSQTTENDMTTFSQQFAAAARQYDNAAPAADEPAFGMDEAISNVADKLIEIGEVGEIIEEVIDADGILNWIAANVDIPAWGVGSFRALLRRADSLEKMADAEYEALNAPFEPDDE